MHKEISEHEKLFDYYFDNYYQKVKCYAFGILKNDDEALEVAQDSFMNLWQNIENIDIKDNIAGYLFTAAKWKCLNILNKKKKSLKYKDYAQSKGVDYQLNLLIARNSNLNNIWDSELVEIIQQTLMKMPQKTQEVFYMNKFYNYSHSDIAERMDCSIKTIEYRMSCALKVLRIALKDYMLLLLGLLFI